MSLWKQRLEEDFFKLAQYLLQNNPVYARCVLSEDAVNALPKNGVLQLVIVYYDMNNYSNGENQEPTDSSGSKDSNFSSTQLRGLEKGAIEERLC